MFMFAKWRRDNNGWTLDWWRHVLERIDPADYLAMNYFDKWVQSCIAVLIDDGTAEMRDFVSAVAALPAAGPARPSKRANAAQGAATSIVSSADGASVAVFQVGDTVKGKLSLRRCTRAFPRMPEVDVAWSASITGCKCFPMPAPAG
jgi:hypothetical protein